MEKKINLHCLRMALIVLTFCQISQATYCQQISESPFEKKETWKDVLAEATKENKIIVLDAFATWCGPCKLMDKEVFPDSVVFNLLKTRFVAIQVQFDKTNNDSENIKNWYDDAQVLQQLYKIDAFPTILFINPNGTLANKGIGFHNVNDFIKLLKEAVEPENNYSNLVSMYQDNKLTDQEILKLSYQASKFHDDSLALSIAKKYKARLLDHQVPLAVLSPELQDFLVLFPSLFTSRDSIAIYMAEHANASDQLIGNKGFSNRFSEFLVTRDIVTPFIKPKHSYSSKTPDWDSLEKKIRTNYNAKIGTSALINAKLDWYGNKHDWDNIIRFNIERLEFDGIDTVGVGKSVLNNMVYNLIFQHATEKWALNKGISYMKVLLSAAPDRDTWLDTYANLLYKLGRKAEAVEHERKALNIAKKRHDKSSEKEYLETLLKFKKNQPTWIVK